MNIDEIIGKFRWIRIVVNIIKKYILFNLGYNILECIGIGYYIKFYI